MIWNVVLEKVATYTEIDKTWTLATLYEANYVIEHKRKLEREARQ